MRHIIWRNRASAILGIILMIIPFTGFPGFIKESLIIILGFLIAVFGFYHGSNNYVLTNDDEDNRLNNDLTETDDKETEELNIKQTKEIKIRVRSKKDHPE